MDIIQKIDSASSLRAAILELEKKHTEEGKLVKDQFLIAYESVKPINLIKSTFQEATESWNLKDTNLKTIVGLLGKIALEIVTNAPIKKLIINAAMNGIAKVVEKNPDAIGNLGTSVLKMIWSKFGKKDQEEETEKPFVDSHDIFE